MQDVEHLKRFVSNQIRDIEDSMMTAKGEYRIGLEGAREAFYLMWGELNHDYSLEFKRQAQAYKSHIAGWMRFIEIKDK